MNFDEAMNTNRPQFSRVINSMPLEKLLSLCSEFEQKLDTRLMLEYSQRFTHHNSNTKSMLLDKLVFMYFVFKTSVTV